ncbi:hypothetical protein [Curtobacterium sp. csp3]|uniref:hypothetical protein n=1 Tax=Curtobacterium sp. csp3 TaxID=2588937 RepID=UPI0015986456|nr:hypothetical protein [Curtobacterium sp. csp3]QKS12671.1 hypothetical protein HUN60_05585 [Curtobacterium sp. csp3]
MSTQRPGSALDRLAAPWRPLLGDRYATEIARRKISFAIAFPTQLAIWVLAWMLGLSRTGPSWIMPVLIIGSAAVTVATIVRFGRFGARARRDLAHRGAGVVIPGREVDDEASPPCVGVSYRVVLQHGLLLKARRLAPASLDVFPRAGLCELAVLGR